MCELVASLRLSAVVLLRWLSVAIALVILITWLLIGSRADQHSAKTSPQWEWVEAAVFRDSVSFPSRWIRIARLRCTPWVPKIHVYT